MINWLNSNQGFVMCLLTLVYVLATVVIVIMNKMSINEMRKSRLEDNRPYIMANLVKDPRDRCFYVRIKNYGKTGAVITNFNIFPELNLWDRMSRSPRTLALPLKSERTAATATKLFRDLYA